MNRTHLAWTALALALSGLFVADQNRPWKRLQAEAREAERQRLRAELAAERRRAGGAESRLRGDLDDARRRFDERRDEVQGLERQLVKARHSARWAARELARLRRRAAVGDGAAARLDEELWEARRRFEERRRSESELEQQLADLRSELTAIEGERAREAQRAENLGRRLAELEKGAFWRLVPALRGLDPALSAVEVSPPGLDRLTPLGRVERVDRCMTCHLRHGEPPGSYGAHPGGLVGEGTPHPPRLFGCTVCHGGAGRATDFSRAGHWPASAEQEAEWIGKWGFSRRDLPPEPIRPTALVEAGCAQCHGALPPQSPRGDGESPPEDDGFPPDRDRPERIVSLALGNRLVNLMGCTGCHGGPAAGGPAAGGPAAGEPKRGPPLGRLAAKTTPEWTFHWIAAPRRFRPTTWMPHLFSGDGDAARRTAVIRAMVRYLWARSEGGPAGAESEPPAGSPEAGGELFATVGCTGCHLLAEAARRDGAALERLHGPNLARTGNKVRAGWLYAWLRDPRSHRADTPMPSLRLSAQEAADLTAYLMASRDEEWRGLELPPVAATVRDQLVLEYLQAESTLAASAARLAEMTDAEKDLFLGQRSLRAHGCHGCHDVPGLDDEPPPAGPLTEIGRPARRLLARDSVAAVAHERRAPDRLAAPPAPGYGMSRREADAVLVSLLSRTPAAVAPWRRAEQGERASLLAAGRRLLARYGCLGCHRSQGRGGAVAATLAERAGRPPDLTSAGARLRSPWLFAYLHDPGGYARRPWLTVRMPTFHWQRSSAHGPEEADVLVRFFAARDGETLFATPPPALAEKEVAVGRAVAAMLQCRECHQGSPEAQNLAPAELAPSYRGVRQRLRPDWAVGWILDPESRIPGTGMPVSFAKNEAGVHDSDYLKATITAPMFAAERQRLLAFFESEEELVAYLADAPQVAVALRDYLWSLE